MRKIILAICFLVANIFTTARAAALHSNTDNIFANNTVVKIISVNILSSK